MNTSLRNHIRVQTRNNVAINLALNGFIAWWLLKDKPALDAWGESAYGPDLLFTGFLLAGIVAAFMIGIHRGQARKGVLAPVDAAALGALALIPADRPWLSSALFGVFGALLSAALIGVLMLLPLPPFSPIAYALFKGVWAGILAGIVVPPAIIVGLNTGP